MQAFAFYALMAATMVVSLVLLTMLWNRNQTLGRALRQIVPDPSVLVRGKGLHLEFDADRLHELSMLDNQARRLVEWLWTLTSIFPMLGIAGTLTAVYGASLEDIASLSRSFQFALGTTIAGIFGAVATRLFLGLAGPTQQQNARYLEEIRAHYFGLRRRVEVTSDTSEESSC